MKFINSILVLLLFLVTSAPLAHAQNLSISDLRNNPDGFNAVLQSAQATSVSGAGLGQPSNKIENKTFAVSFTAVSDSDRLVIFSDDGCDVSIQDVTPIPQGSNIVRQFGGIVVNVLAAKGSGQALPNLLQSLHRLSFGFLTDHTYQLTLRSRVW